MRRFGHRFVTMLALALASMAHAQLKNRSYSRGELAVVPGEPIVVTEFGVYPDKIVRPEGPFVLFIENRLPGHTERFSLTLDRDEVELRALNTTARKFHDATLVDLEPGKYRLRFGKRPGFWVLIEIQRKK